VSTAPDVLIVAAFPPELAPLRPHLGGGLEGRVGTLRVVACAVGIGLPQAAAGATAHVGNLRPRAVVAVGTCGAYAGSSLAIGQVVVARRVRLVDPSALRGLSEAPQSMCVSRDAHAPMAQHIAGSAGARTVDVATTLGVTVDDATAAAIAQATGAEVEHLEAYGMATACAVFGVPFGAVLAVANGVGVRARAEWREHHRAASAGATGAVMRWLAGEGPFEWDRLAK
jgi:nucleoside phosphorylase